jgi:inosine-uridine nucleoside N-ribohydrolase
VREPELISRIRIVLMGGCWSRAEAETNIRSDPEAAAIVFNSGVEIQ